MTIFNSLARLEEDPEIKIQLTTNSLGVRAAMLHANLPIPEKEEKVKVVERNPSGSVSVDQCQNP